MTRCGPASNNDISPLLRASTNPWGISADDDKPFSLGPANDEEAVSTLRGHTNAASGAPRYNNATSAWVGAARAPPGFESSVARAPPGFESVQREPRRMNSAEDLRNSGSSGGTGGFRRNMAALRVSTGSVGSFNQVQQLAPTVSGGRNRIS